MRIENPADYNVGLYLRLSKEDLTKGTVESQSISNQRDFLLAFCKENLLTVKEIYADDGISGVTDNRPYFQRMLDDVKRKKINMVVTKDLSRLSRNMATSVNLIDCFFPENNARCIAVLDGIDTGIDTASNEMTPFKAVFNEFHAKNTSSTVKAAKHRKQLDGKFLGGHAAYGYVLSKTERNKIEVDPVVAPIVQRMFDMAASGVSCRQIAVTFNEECIPTPATYAGIKIAKKGPYSGLWSSERVSYTLQNELYLGHMVQGRSKNLSYKSDIVIKTPKDKLIVVKNTHEPLVSQEVFDKVQEQIKSRARTRSCKYDFLMKGLIFCHECGKPLGILARRRASGNLVQALACRTYARFTKDSACTLHYVPLDTINEAVFSKIREVCEKYINRDACEKVAAVAREEKRRRNNDEQELSRVLEKQRQVDKMIDKLMEQNMNGILEGEDFQRMYRDKTTERAFLKKQEAVIRERLLQTPIDEPIDALIKQFLDSIEVNRDLLVSLVERIEYSENKESGVKQVFIHFKFRQLELLSGL